MRRNQNAMLTNTICVTPNAQWRENHNAIQSGARASAEQSTNPSQIRCIYGQTTRTGPRLAGWHTGDGGTLTTSSGVPLAEGSGVGLGPATRAGSQPVSQIAHDRNRITRMGHQPITRVV